MEMTNSSGIPTDKLGGTNTIDDEFAMLFLRELQNTRLEPIREGEGSLETAPENAKIFSPAHTQGTELDFLGAMENTDSDHKSGMKGAASYAMYLPQETILNSNFPDLNDLYPYDRSQNLSNISLDTLMKNTEAVFSRPALPEQRPNTLSIPATSPLPVQLQAGAAGSMTNVNSLQFSTVREEPVSMHTGLSGEDPALDERFTVTQMISEKVLTLYEKKSESPPDACSPNIMDTLGKSIVLKGGITGKIYIDRESYGKLSSNISQMSLEKNENLALLFCYRRNSTTISLPMDLRYIKELQQRGLESAFDQVTLCLHTSLRKFDGKDKSKISVITGFEEFSFNGSSSGLNGNIISINSTKTLVSFSDLLRLSNSYNEVIFLWDQIKFKSATANNRHDAANKHYNVILDVSFEKTRWGKVQTLLTKTLESQKIIVRGRNPSFYSQKGDILIGKIKKIASTRGPRANKMDLKEKLTSLEGNSCKENIVPAIEPANGSNVCRFGPNPDSTGHGNGSQDASPSSVASSYKYYRASDNYYLPPVDVGYFPHYVHHSNSVLKAGGNR
ncbi:unnamed protein product [Pichia kudriavzevii]